MNDTDLYTHILESDIFHKWHWFRYHFEHRLHGYKHPLAESFIESCLICDQKIPGFAKTMVDNIAYISGSEKHEPHYEQLLQRLAELLIIRQVVSYNWETKIKIEYEPTAGNSKKNPEVTVNAKDFSFGIEVKAPSLLNHIRVRKASKLQIAARSPYAKGAMKWDKEASLPRDNPVKDFLISANEKFKQFKSENPAFLGLLIIVWDDHVYEPISSLLHPVNGLFTPNSFAKDINNQPLRFDYLDGVIILRHLHQFISSTRNEPLVDDRIHPFDYGVDGQFPPKIFIPAPNGQPIPCVILNCFQAKPFDISTMGAEYIPTDFVFWF